MTEGIDSALTPARKAAGDKGVSAVVAPAADLLRVGAAVAVHEVSYGELEVVVVEVVEVFDGVAQPLRPDLLPSGCFLASTQPQPAGSDCGDQDQGQDPRMGGRP